MRIRSPLFGEMDIDPEQILHFPEGLPAFNDQRRFVILPMDKNSPFYYLQAVDNADLCFLLADPFPFWPHYQAELGDAEVQKLQAAQDGSNISLFTILTIPADFKNTTANLLAPLIINTERKIGLQIILANADYTTKHPLFSATPSEKNQLAGEGL